MAYNRYDIPQTVVDVLEAAIEHDVIDHKDVLALGMTHGQDYKGMVDEIVQYAYSNRHVNDSHNHVCKAAEAFWKEII